MDIVNERLALLDTKYEFLVTTMDKLVRTFCRPLVKCLNAQPMYSTAEAAGADILAVEDMYLYIRERQAIKTGVFTEIPEGYEAQIRPRSSMTLKGIDVPLGTIDSDYRGEWKVIVVNNSDVPYKIGKGDKIAQVVFSKVERVQFQTVPELKETERGSGGFGSTGV